MNTLTKLESEVLEMLLSHSDNATLKHLKQQVNHAVVVKREFTDAGFFTQLLVSPDIPRRIDQNFQFGDVVAEIDGLSYGAGFVLFIKDGVLNTLEGYCYDEVWPSSYENFKLTYIDNEKRDLESLPEITKDDN